MSKVMSPKKMIAVMVAMLVALMIAVPAMADPLPPATGNLHIHKFIGGPTGGVVDGQELNTGSWSDAVAVNGVKFDLYKINTSSGIPASGGIYLLNGSTLEVYSSFGVLQGTFPVTSAGSVTTAGNGLASANGLTQGMYLVIEDTSAPGPIVNAATGEQMFISSAMAPFVVAVPMTNPLGSGWLGDVHVYPKNEALSVEKEVDTNEAVVVGDIIGYKIKVSVPGDIATGEKFDVYDKFDVALDYVANSVEVTTIPAGPSFIEGAAGDYMVSYESSNRTLTVSFTENGRVKLGGHPQVLVAFKTKVNALILEKIDLEVSNTGQVEFVDEDGTSYKGESGGGGTKIYTSAIQVTKLNELGAALNGSSFKIATSQENADAGRFLRIDGEGVIHNYPATEWTALGSSGDYEISPGNIARFVGLRDTVNNVPQTYYVVESKAPNGYNLLSSPVVVTFSGEEVDHIQYVQVTNSKGFILPVTGGVGTIAFTVIGIALLGSAIILVISRKRKSNKELY